MGLFDRLVKRVPPAAGPMPIAAKAEPGVVCAPVAGRLMLMCEVPDPVFSGEMLGKGCAVWPDSDVVYAPIDGTVTVTMDHAVGISGDDGVDVLVHVGVDTVNMKGDGFERLAAKGEHVRAGDPLLRFDRAKIKSSGHPDCVVIAVSNSAEMSAVEVFAESGAMVDAGSALIGVTK